MKNNWPLTLMKAMLLVCLISLSSAAQSTGIKTNTRPPTGQPISSVLNADGSIKQGISGSFDPKGFRMASGPDGSPRFFSETKATSSLSPTTNCNDSWDDRFWTNGPSGAVYAVSTDNAGNIYVGGSFATVGNLIVNHIAKWDGVSWSPLGTGVDGVVQSIGVLGTDVYVGGIFTTAGGVAVNGIAKWNSSSWSALGSGMQGSWGEVYAIGVAGTDVYAGGYFTSAGGVPANNIAKWDGSSWLALGSGIDGGGSQTAGVRAIAVSGTDVYVGGWFATAGGGTVNNIAKWDGSGWSGLGSGVNGYPGIYALAVSGGDVYAGGFFISAGGVATNIAKWNGTSWSALGSGVGGTSWPGVYAIAVSGSDVYAGGYFTSASGVPANHIAKWNGSNWSALGSGINGGVRTLRVAGADVYAGSEAIGIGKWNGSSWSDLEPSGNGLGINGIVSAAAVSGIDVYVAGSFTSAGGVSAHKIAKWNGSVWSALGSGVSGDNAQSFSTPVSVIAVSGGDVYVGGDLTVAGGVPANHIAKWNGSAWSALGSGVGGAAYSQVLAIAISGSDVYAGGNFVTAGGAAGNGIVKWNGSSWSALGTGLDGYVFALAVSGTDIYAGGHFATAGGTTVNNIAKWNGSSWSALSTGVGAPGGDSTIIDVETLAASGGYLYVAGGFPSAGEVPGTSGIAKWDGSNWSALGSGIKVGIYCDSADCYYDGPTDIAISSSDVYFGGGSYGIFKWNGSSVSSLGSVTNGAISALVVSGPDLYVAGQFSTAGCHAASNFSRYSQVTTAAMVSVSGRVLSSDGRGVRGAYVTISGPSGTRTTPTGRAGAYRFDDVATGADYTISVAARRYRFQPRVLQVYDELTNVDLIAEGLSSIGAGIQEDPITTIGIGRRSGRREQP